MNLTIEERKERREILKSMQGWSLYEKIKITEYRIQDWIDRYGVDGVYISFSGGKDSTVLLHIARQLYPNIEAVFINTGLEYPEIQTFARSFDNVTVLQPKMRFDEVIKKHGYPFISKEVADDIFAVRTSKGKYAGIRLQKLLGTFKDKNGEKSKFNCEKYEPLLHVDYLIGGSCCRVMRKSPAHSFTRRSGRKPITAQMAEESRLREQQWVNYGCNGFDMKAPISNPMAFWTEQDVLNYIREYSVKLCSVYGEVVYDNGGGERYESTLCDNGCKLKCTGCQRTGCIFCGFGAHHDCDGGGESRFARLKHTHPRQYEYCMGGGAYDEDGLWKPNKDGLGMAHCIDKINKIYGENFIKY